MTEEWRDALAGQRVVVTGGAGVIGGEMLELLSELGATVLSIDRLPLVAAPPVGVEHVMADLAVADLDPIVRFRPRHIVHLAATFERSVETPDFWEWNWNDNVVATHRLADLAAQADTIEAVTFASSYLVYEPGQYLSTTSPDGATGLTEGAALGPRNLCGAAKLYGEAELRFATEVRGARARMILARIFRVYGRGSRDVVSRWVRAALAGETVDLYHAENRFDYVFSRDVAEGLLRLTASPRAAGVVNLASGRDRSVGDVIAAIEGATRRTLETRAQALDEPFEASRAELDRLRSLVSWTPQTTLEAGVAQLVEHERASATSGILIADA